MNERFNWPSSIKGILMLFIVSTHCGVMRIDNVNQYIANTFGCADKIVQGFVVLSVVLCIQSYAKKGINNNREWIIAHIYKLLPLYFLALICTLIVRGPSYLWIQPDETISFFNYISHLFLVNYYVPNYNNAFGMEWYVGVVIMVYILTPVLHWCAKTFKRSVISLGGSIVICDIIQRTFMYVLANHYPGILVEKYSTYFSAFSYIGCMGIGVLLSYFYQNAYFDKVKKKKIVSCILLIVWIVSVFCVTNYGMFQFIVDMNTLCGAISILLIISFMIYSNPLIGNRIIVFIGDKSYVYYLFNYCAISVVATVVDKISSNNSSLWYMWILKYLTSMVVLYILDIVLNKLYNQPVLKVIRCCVNKKRENEI